jgi:hypothetical protein
MLPLIAILLVVLMGFAALSVDAGYLRYEQNLQQSAADSAAIAGASELAYSTAIADVTAAADADAAANGFADTSTIAVANPPANGTYSGNTAAVQVVINTTQPTAFEAVLGRGSNQLQTIATATSGSAGSVCLYGLSASQTSNFSKGVTLNSPTCGMMLDGNYNANSATLTMSSIGVAGTISGANDVYADGAPGAAIPAGDPCPSLVGCAYLKSNPPATSPCNYTSLSVNSATTLYQGVYCGKTTLNSSGITLSPGVYVFTGGLEIDSATVVGTGVTMYIAGGALAINSKANVNFTAPLTGNTEGVLFYQPSSDTTAPALNTASFALQGVLYFPGAQFTITGGSTLKVMIIAGSLSMSGSSDFYMPSGPNFPGGPLNVTLVEN